MLSSANTLDTQCEQNSSAFEKLLLSASMVQRAQCREEFLHTQPPVTLILVSFTLPAATADSLDDYVDVAEDNHWWWEDRSVMECHDQLVPLELPDLVGY